MYPKWRLGFFYQCAKHPSSSWTLEALFTCKHWHMEHSWGIISKKLLAHYSVRLLLDCDNQPLDFQWPIFLTVSLFVYDSNNRKIFPDMLLVALENRYTPLPSSGPEELPNYVVDKNRAGKINNVIGLCFLSWYNLKPVSCG